LVIDRNGGIGSMPRNERFSPYPQIPVSRGVQNKPWYESALGAFAWPFEQVEKYAIKPALASIAGVTGITDRLERIPDESWLDWKKREWEEWDDPSIGLWFKSPTTGEQAQIGIKGAAEMAPWFLLPGVGWAGRGVMAGKAAVAGRGLAGMVAKTAPSFGRAAPIVRNTY